MQQADLFRLPEKVYVYPSVFNFGDTVITSQNWTFTAKPTGSNATLTSIPSLVGTNSCTDSLGTYTINVSIVTSTGTKDTAMNIYVSKFVGTGRFCRCSCSLSELYVLSRRNADIHGYFNRWKVRHANIFKYQIDSGAAYYSTACMKCHTTGYDHNLVNNNNGFDDVTGHSDGMDTTARVNSGKWNEFGYKLSGTGSFCKYRMRKLPRRCVHTFLPAEIQIK